jgi:hypothetical protein
MDRKACGTTGESDGSDQSGELIRSITYQSATRSIQHRSILPKVVTTSRIVGLTSLNDMDDRTTTMSEMIPSKGRRRRRKGYIKGFPTSISTSTTSRHSLSTTSLHTKSTLDHIVCSQHEHLDHYDLQQRQRQQRSPISILPHPTISSTSN